MKWIVDSEQRTATRLAHCARSLSTIHYSLFTALLLFTVHCSLSTAFAATQVTATYDLGANPKVMATVNGTPEYGLVFAQRNKRVTYGDVEYGPSVVKGYLNASGQLNDGASHLWLDLIPNLGATPGDSYYVVTFNIQGRVHAEIWVVPDVATVAAEVCRQAQPPSSTAPALFYQFLQQDGDDLPQRQKLNFTGSGVSCVDNSGQLRTDCTVTGGGGGSAPKASATVSGTVKTDATESDPVVYLKSSADTLLAAKAPLAHSHAESEVTNLVTDLAGKVPTTRAINTTSPLSGGGALSADLTLSLPAATGSQNGYLTSANWTTFNNKENALTFNSPLARAVNAISCPTCEVTGNKNAASGYAGLDASTKLAAAQLPTPGATTLGGVKSLTCGGTDKLSAIGTDGVPVCSTDQTGGGSSHEILSATHTDTTVATVVRGDLITGQGATPKWTRLAKGTQYQVFTGGVSEPAWSAVALDQSSAVSGVLAAGNGGTGSAYFAVSGPASTAKTFTFPNQNATMEYQANKNAASGYAGLTAGTKLTAAQGQEVWSSADLTDFANKSGTGTTILGATFTSLATNDIPKWNGTNWVNSASAAKADALTNDPTDCGSNQYATGIAASGNLTCAQPATSNLSDGSNVVKNNQANTYTGGGLQDLSAQKLALPAATSLPGTCTANKEIYVDTDATPAGQQVYLCNSSGNGWNLIGDGGGGGGTTITVNGASVNSTADLDDTTPVAPTNGVNVKWQKDALTPTNISAYWLSTAVGTTTFGSGSSFTWSFNDDAASNSTIQFDAGGINITPSTMVYVAAPLQAEYGDTATGNLLTLYGDAVSAHTSGTRTTAIGVRGYGYHDAPGGTLTNAIGVSGLAAVGAGTVGAAMALQAQSPTKGAGTIGNAFGLYVQAQTAGTNNYAIWTNGAEQSRFGGLVNAVGGFQVNGAATNHAVLLGNGTIFQASVAIPDCQDTDGKHLNYTQSSQAFSCGTSGGGSTSWSSLTNAGTNLTLANAGWTTTFNQTSAVNWTWANTTAATSGVEQDSPLLKLSGQYWNGSTSAEDYWTIQNNIASGTNGVSTLEFIHTGSSGSYPKVAFPRLYVSNIEMAGNNFQGRYNNSNVAFIGGSDNTASGSTGTATLRAGDITGGSGAYTAGATTVRGGDNASNNASANAGNLTIRSGLQSVNTSASQGALSIQQSFYKGATVTANNVVCLSSSNTVTDCTTSATDAAGVADTVTGTGVQVATAGTHTVNFDGTYSPSVNWFACTSASTAGQVTPQSAACAAGRQVGMVTVGGTSVTSGTIEIRRTSSVTASGSGISTLNTLTATTQTFATPGTSGTAPNWSSVTDTHTLNIPLAATASVTAGLISKTQYDRFNAARSITYIAGADSAGSALADTDDQATFFRNNIAAMTITEVWCESDAGTPTIDIYKDDGSPATILSGAITCTTSGATGTITDSALAVGDKLDFLIGTAGGTAKRVTVSIKATVN